MAPSSNADTLPSFLTNAWRFNQYDFSMLASEDQLENWTVSSLAETHLKAQLKIYETMTEEQQLLSRNYFKARSLTSLSAGKIIEVLEGSDNLNADVQTIAKSLTSTTLRQVLEDPRTSYTVLRLFLALPSSYGPANAAETARTLVDIDEAIITNEHYIRSRGAEKNKDNKGLVSLDHASLLFGTSLSADIDHPLTIRRKDPPKGGFEFLDEQRPRTLQIQPNSKLFAETFHRITRGILRGLDWSNVFIAGGIALTTLLHADRSVDDRTEVKESDIDVYIYGLGPKEANDKVKHIYEVWSSNLPADNKQRMVVKNSKTINFLADYPNRRIQIVLKLIQSPTHVLLNFDLDACALGFNGKEVLMLPRCARAIETGYSTFTMDLVWGHHLGDRRATQEIRVFKYADRGFGLRILPSYVRSLEESQYSQRKNMTCLPGAESNGTEGADDVDNNSEEPEWTRFVTSWRVKPKDRKPSGPEPGLKTLKRIAYLGRDFVHSYYFGATPLTQCPEHEDQEEWQREFDETKAENDKLKVDNDRRRAAGERLEGPLISLNSMDTRDIHDGLPGGRRGLGGFELFMRHCEAWRLHARGDATLDMSSFSSTVYDGDEYDDVPEYKWDSTFDAGAFARQIERHNDTLFENLKHVVCQRLQLQFQRTGWRDYLTRRIRRQVHGPDVDTVFEKQVTMPVVIPYDLEQFIHQIVSDALSDAGILNGDMEQVLIPIHEQGKGTAILSDLQDTAAPSGNVRFWVIGNELMWAGIDRRIDEVFEVLWSLFHWQHQSASIGLAVQIDRYAAVHHLAQAFRRRLPPQLEMSPSKKSVDLSDTQLDASTSTSPAHLRAPRREKLSPREAILFRRWAFHTPSLVNRNYNDDGGRHIMFDDENVLYPFPDHLFWNAGDEGELDGDGVPQWHDVESVEDDDDENIQKEKGEGRKRKRESTG
ncbi:MAG: hypothetical protein M1830_006297 [Pleopsidium flavum]|nr:MAG: hypothetical protein M1830_006297 [Pleopsidium flavum]